MGVVNLFRQGLLDSRSYLLAHTYLFVPLDKVLVHDCDHDLCVFQFMGGNCEGKVFVEHWVQSLVFGSCLHFLQSFSLIHVVYLHVRVCFKQKKNNLIIENYLIYPGADF